MSIRLHDFSMPFPTLGDDPRQRTDIKRFSKVYPGLKRPHPAAGFIRSGERIVDYFEQAPCLLDMIGDKASVAALKERQPLRTLLALAGGSQVLRRLKGVSVIGVPPHAFRRLAQLNPSLVAQAIPNEISLQRSFLLAATQGLSFDPGGRLDRTAWDEWFVSRFARLDLPLHTVADFVTRSGRPFDLRWSAEEALAAAHRWHADLGRMTAEKSFFMRHGIDFEDDVDYGPFPLEYAHGDFTFVALRSGAALYEDSRAMHHCVGSYSEDVIAGTSRIYSIRVGAKRVATLEFDRTPPLRSWRLRQICGPCNARPGKPVIKASEAFLVDMLQRERRAA